MRSLRFNATSWGYRRDSLTGTITYLHVILWKYQTTFVSLTYELFLLFGLITSWNWTRGNSDWLRLLLLWRKSLTLQLYGFLFDLFCPWIYYFVRLIWFLIWFVWLFSWHTTLLAERLILDFVNLLILALSLGFLLQWLILDFLFFFLLRLLIFHLLLQFVRLNNYFFLLIFFTRRRNFILAVWSIDTAILHALKALTCFDELLGFVYLPYCSHIWHLNDYTSLNLLTLAIILLVVFDVIVF